jgi:integrase
VRRKVGDVRTPGQQDGLTITQAERKFASMRHNDPPRRRQAGDARVTMKEAGDELARTLVRKNRKKSHRLTVASDLRTHIVPFFEGRPLEGIDADDIERYVDVKTRTLAVKTVRNHLNTMHSVFQIGLRKGWCRHNPVKLAERPAIKKTETRIRFLTQPEVDTLVTAPYPADAWGSIEPTLYLTAAMTGLRQGELLGLRWRDVDFHARRIRVVSPYVRGEFADPKSDGSGRSVPMAPLQASDRARRRPTRHLPRAPPHLRHSHGRPRRTPAPPAGVDGPRRRQDHPDLRPLPASRERSRGHRPRVRVEPRVAPSIATPTELKRHGEAR